MFVRFIIGSKDRYCGVHEGVFGIAYELRNASETPTWQAQELTRLPAWFAANLQAPDRSNNTKSKGYYHRNGMAICWFKPEATEHIAKIRELSAILEEHGYTVRMIRTRRPGYVVYEDDHQVAAVPFSSTTTR